MLVYPVIISIPNNTDVLDRKLRHYYTRLIARKSAVISSQRSGLFLSKLCKNTFGVPLTYAGLYWSITHKSKYVGGVTSIVPIGIDIEKIQSRYYDFMHAKVANPLEWNLVSDDRTRLFFRYWTAKEAVLKAEGVGLVGLSKCFVKKVISDKSMLLEYGSKNKWYVEHLFFDKHVAAIAIEAKNIIKIKWFIFE